MKVTWRLYCAAPAAQCADFMPCCPGRRVAAGVSGARADALHPWAIPGTRAELAAWPFARWLFMWSDLRIAAAGTSFDSALMGSQGG